MHAAAAAFGLRVEGGLDGAGGDVQTFWLWPDCVDAWWCWVSVQTQWRHAGMDGARTGLDYTAVLAFIELHVPEREDRVRMLEDVRDCERVALAVWREQAARQASQRRLGG